MFYVLFIFLDSWLFHGARDPKITQTIINEGFDFRVANLSGSIGGGTCVSKRVVIIVVVVAVQVQIILF